MTTAATKKQAPVLKYDLTVGLSAMEGRGFYYPTDTARRAERQALRAQPLSGWGRPVAFVSPFAT